MGRARRVARLLAGCTLLACLALLVLGCSRPAPAPQADEGGVHPKVVEANAEVGRQPALADTRPLADAKRGFIAAPTGQVRNAAGEVVWDFDAYAFVKGEAPSSVNPSLWRQALLNNQVGLFKVADRIWQLRGFDLANITLIEGQTGWIVIDTLTTQETARAAMAFARQHLGDKPVSAVVFTHSHADHFGGALGVLSAEEAKARQVPVVAPAGFMEEATSENILVGAAMARRATYMYGNLLPKNATGSVDTGLGKLLAIGRVGLLPPTQIIEKAQEERVIDGVRFVFHSVHGTEAPSEFVFSLPDLKAFCGAELMSHTLHNLYTLRGAKVRDALRWADALDRSLQWAAGAEVVFNQHHWPVWGAERIAEFIVKQRDAYKYIHDQTVRLLNDGRNAAEIAEQIRLPKPLDDFLSVRGYYGTVSHNVKGVYQFYMGWFDGNPANLNALPATEASKGYVKLAGGMGPLLAQARQAYDAGDFRWAAELLKHAVFAEPEHPQARALFAQSLTQMGYLAESAPWRNFYLSGAHELRHGTPKTGVSLANFADMLQYAPTERFLERMAASINGPKAGDLKLRINLVFSDRPESHRLHLENGVLYHRAAAPDPEADATLTLTKAFFLRMMTGQVGAKDLLLSDEAKISGSRIDLGRFLVLVEKANPTFPIVTR